MNGVIVIRKEKDYTSFDVVAVVRKLLHIKKIGHTGTLDPMAEGVLPILVGRAAKAQELLPDTDKTYLAEFQLGMTTDTLDITGKLLSRQESHVSEEMLQEVLPEFRGEIMQVPPMYSAVSKNGVRLYELARKGIVIEREPRPVQIRQLELRAFDPEKQTGRLEISCSKGTYIRSLCDDIGRKLGCGCVMTALCRTRACGFTIEEAITLEQLRQFVTEGRAEEFLRQTDSIFSDYPAMYVTHKQAFRYYNGGALALDRLKQPITDQTVYRIYGSLENGKEQIFLGLGKSDLSTGELQIVKRFVD